MAEEDQRILSTRMKLAILGGLVLALLVAGMIRVLWAKSQAVTSRGAAVRMTPPAKLETPKSDPDEGFIGVILARESVQVSPKIDGAIAAMHVRLGDRVEAGAPIATLDTSLMKKELAVDEAVLQASRSDREKSDAELVDLKVKLDSSKRITQYVSAAELKSIESQYLAGVAKLESAKATVMEKQARVNQLKEQLANAEVRAPFAGIIAVRYVDLGALVSTTKPIVRLVSDDRFLRFAVPEEARSTVRPGQTVVASLDSLNVRATAVVEKMSPEVDTASGTIFVEAMLTDKEQGKDKLPSGSVAHVKPQ